MNSSWAFGSPFSLLERLQRHANGMLCRYWRLSRTIYGLLIAGAVIPAVGQWFFESVVQHGRPEMPDLTRYPPVQVLLSIPIPITVAVLLTIIGSIFMAGQASRNHQYYELLDASARIYRLSRRGYRAITAQLQDNDRPVQPARVGESGEAYDGLTIFDDLLYTERTDALKIYADFLNQRRQRILLVVGHGGAGKSTFLLHRMGELSGELGTPALPFRPHPCVFINCKLDHLTSLSKLPDIISRKLGSELSDILGKSIRGRHNRALVIFVDAINENVASAEDDINVHLTNFTQEYLNGQHDVYLCVSVRETYWDEQRRRLANNPTSADLAWLDYVYLPDRRALSGGTPSRSAETASVLLENFDHQEFANAYENYQRVYSITGTIPDERTRKICSNPLMLQVFSIMFRGQDIRDLDIVRNLVRDLDIFDAYAVGALARTAELVGMRAAQPIKHGETLAQRAIRGLLLELSLGMVAQGRQFLSDDEVFTIAQDRAPEALAVGGVRIDTADGLYRDGSVLKALLAEGIILEPGLGIISGRNQVSGIRFVSERYLEYSIGRALVRRWRLGNLERDDIISELQMHMDRHIKLRSQSFDNLRQGLGMAVLVAEQPDSHLPQAIHFDLLGILAHDADFDWNQLACRVLPQLKPFNRAAPVATAEYRHEVENLLTIIDELAKKNDFVLRWDLERALLHAVEAGEGQAILHHLQAWMEPTATFSQRIFSGESLGYLFKQRADYRREVVGALRHIIETAPGLDFWILRSFMFSVGTMMDTLESSAQSTEADRLQEELGLLARELLRFGRGWWDRSVVLAGQIERDALHHRLARWLAWPWDQESPWTRVNVALAAEEACTHGCCTTDTVELLHQLWQPDRGYHPHLSWAIWHVLGQATGAPATCEPARAAATQLRALVTEEARGILDRDTRAAWILQSELPSDQRVPDEIATSAALVYHPEYGHTDLHNHPESKERVQAILDFLDVPGLGGGRDGRELFTYVSPYRFRDWDDQRLLQLVHTREWIRRVQDLSTQLAEEEKSDIVLESDLEVRAGSYSGAGLAVRGTVCAVDLVISSPSVCLAVALVRPPGHLAGNKICIFNNVAIAARYGQEVLAARTSEPMTKPHVLIVDCDAHHGKSTQDTFYSDGSVVYFSIHQAGVHPGTGRFEERGREAGTGSIVNVPIPAGSGDGVYGEVLQRILKPILECFRPELIFVSMGFDAYYNDDFSQLELSEWSYQELAAILLSYCQQHPKVGVVASLEGGYDVESMGRCCWQFMSTFGEWASQAGQCPAPRLGKSWLDRYLQERDAGEEPTTISESEKQWLEDLTALELELRNQWMPSG